MCSSPGCKDYYFIDIIIVSYVFLQQGAKHHILKCNTNNHMS